MSEPSPKSLRTAEEAFARYVVVRDLVPPISSTLSSKSSVGWLSRCADGLGKWAANR